MLASSYNVLALVSLVFLSFGNLVLSPRWESAVSFLAALSFSGFLVWLNPARKLEVNRKEFEKLEADTKDLREQLTQLRIKIGFQRVG